jgi:hypothetical protein
MGYRQQCRELERGAGRTRPTASVARAPGEIGFHETQGLGGHAAQPKWTVLPDRGILGMTHREC